MNLKALLDKHRVKAGFVGGALVVSTAYGSCHLKPGEASVEEATSEEPMEEAVEPEAEEEEPASPE